MSYTDSMGLTDSAMFTSNDINNWNENLSDDSEEQKRLDSSSITHEHFNNKNSSQSTDSQKTVSIHLTSVNYQKSKPIFVNSQGRKLNYADALFANRQYFQQQL